jgi:hypothetical protein
MNNFFKEIITSIIQSALWFGMMVISTEIVLMFHTPQKLGPANGAGYVALVYFSLKIIAISLLIINLFVSNSKSRIVQFFFILYTGAISLVSSWSNIALHAIQKLAIHSCRLIDIRFKISSGNTLQV